MARRWWVRGIMWSGVGLASLIGALLVALVIITQSAFGRERVRQVAEILASRYLLGSLHLGALRFGPGCTLAVDSAALRDPDDSLLVSLGSARASCRFGALVQRRLIITSLAVERPRVIVRQSPTGEWNWARAIKPDTSPATPSTGPARVVVAGPVRLTDGAVILDVPWAPPDSLRGAARDRAIAAALAAQVPAIRRIGNTLVRRREFAGIVIDAPLVRTEIGDTTTIAELRRIAVRLSDPPIAVHRIAGRVALIGDSADLDLRTVAFDASAARARGRIDWSAPGMPAIDATVIADTLAFADLASLVPNLPGTGGGRFELAVRTAGGTAPVEYRVTSADLHTTRSVVRGGVSIQLDSSNAVIVRSVAVDVAPLHTDLLRVFAGDAIPPALRGALTGRIVGQGGGPTGAIRVDTLDARYADEAVPGSTSRLTGHGTITLGGDAGITFRQFVLDANPIDARTITRILPALSPLSGHLTGTVTLDSTFDHLRIANADLRYAEGTATPLRITGGGRVGVSNAPWFDLELNAQPLAPAALARSYPALATLPSLDGRIEIRGTLSDVALAVTGRSSAGSIALVGRYRDGPTGVGVRATAKLREANPRAATGQQRVPDGRIDADIDVDLQGESFKALRGTATLSNVNGTLAGVAIEPSNARLALSDSRVVAESLVIATSAGVVRAHGALGLRAEIRDTLDVTATVSLAELAPVLRAAGIADSAVRDTSGKVTPNVIDSIGGQVTARARVIGSLDSLDADGEVDGTDLTAPPGRASRAHITATLTGLRSTPRGRASVRVDSLTAGGVQLATVTGSARSDDGHRWSVSLGTANIDTPGGSADGAVALQGDTVTVHVDSLAVRVPGADLRLTRPARLQRTGDGAIALDTLELRGGRGSLIRIAGVYRDTGSIAVSLDVADAPVFLPGPGSPGDSLRVVIDVTARLEGTAHVPRGSAHVRARVAEIDSMLALDSLVADVAYADNQAHVTVNARAGVRDLIAARVESPVQLSLAPATARFLDEPITGTISIDSLYLPDITSLLPGVRMTAGVLRTHLTLSGTSRRPRANGSASLNGGAARIDALGIGVRDANAALELTTDRITITTAKVLGVNDPAGHAELEGVIGLIDTSHIELRLRMAAMPVMRLPQTADLDVTTDLRLFGPNKRPTLSGRIVVDRGVLRLPDMGRQGVVGVNDTAFVRLVDSLAPARARSNAGPSPLQSVEIGGVEVVMGPNVWLRSAEASVQLGGSIGLEKATPGPGVPEGQLALRGALVTQRGTYRLNFGAFTRSFELETGSVQFTGEPEVNPRLDINAVYAREAGEDAAASGARAPRVRAHLGGTLERPVLSLSSADTKLSQAELMSYLVTGQANFALGNAFDQAMVTSELVATATGALAQRLAGGMFDVVNVTPGATTDENRSATAADVFAASRLGIGKQLSSRVFLKVDAGLCALTGNASSTDIGQTLGVSLDYRFHRDLLGSVSSAPSTNGATCANQAAGRGTALTPRQWGLDFDRVWRF